MDHAPRRAEDDALTSLGLTLQAGQAVKIGDSYVVLLKIKGKQIKIVVLADAAVRVERCEAPPPPPKPEPESKGYLS